MSNNNIKYKKKKAKPDLNFWKLWNLSFGFFGVQIAYALQGVGHMGTYLGLFNDTIRLPQIVAALVGGVVLSIIGSAENGAANQPAMLFVAGILLFIAALLVNVIKVNKN